VVLKFRGSDGEMIAGTFLGGTGDDIPTALSVDAQGWIYVAGTTTSRNFPRSEGALQDTNRSATTTGFVAKLHGSLTAGEFSTYLGGNAPTRITGITSDRLGNTYVTGTTDALDFPTTADAFRRTGAASMAFVAKINSGGRALSYSTFLGLGTPAAIAIDPGGNAVIAGTVTGPWPVSADAFQSTRSGGADLFLTRLSLTGATLPYSPISVGPGMTRRWPSRSTLRETHM
jgi:hypothetical protein